VTNQKQGLVKRQGLTRAELAEIKLLAERCNTYEGLDLKLIWSVLEKREPDQTNDFLYYENGTLVGFLPVYSFNSTEAEISGMVHPDYRRRGIFTTLYQEARAECQSRGLTEILLIVEQASSSGQAFARALGADYDHSEYKMVLGEPRLLARVDESLRFRSATPADIPLFVHITAVAFDFLEDDVNWYVAEKFGQAEEGFYVAELDGVVIGKIDVSFSAHGGHIYGFAVLPEYQGRGYGRQILWHTIQEILARGYQHITLEVSVENKHALSLYHSCGFKETGSYDYYRIAIA
jgi:ribosomal protein S18 acetylase RimI-like enzyme